MRRIGWVLGCLALCAGATGCWPQQGQGPDRAAYNGSETTLTPDTVDGLHRLWGASPGDIVGQPVVSPAGVHVAAFDTFDSSAGLDLVTYGTGGQLLWTRPVTPDLLHKPQDASGPLVVGDRVGAGYTFYSSSGNSSEAPSFDVTTGAPAGSLGTGPVVAARDDQTVTTFFRQASPSGDEAGTRVHDLATGQDTLVSRTNTGRFTLGRQRLYRTNFGFVSALAPAPAGEPEELWTANLANPSSSEPVLSPDESTVYVVSSDALGTRGELVALDAATGARRWTANLGAGGTTPALAGGTVYVQTTLGWLIAFDAGGCGATECPSLWEAAVGSGLGTTTQPAVAGDVVYTAWADGSIAATGRTTGDLLWKGSAGSQPITGSPVVSGGRLYVTDAGGTLTAFGL